MATSNSSSSSSTYTASAKEGADTSSRNWKALSIPSLNGSKTELQVSGEVRSGTVPSKLTRRETKENRPVNVFALDISTIGGGEFTPVTFNQDITGSKYDIILVYTVKNEIEAAIRIEKVES